MRQCTDKHGINKYRANHYWKRWLWLYSVVNLYTNIQNRAFLAKIFNLYNLRNLCTNFGCSLATLWGTVVSLFYKYSMIMWGRSSVRESVSFATRRPGVRFPSSPPFLKYSLPQRTRRTQRNRNYKLRRLVWFAFLCSCLATRALRHQEKIRAETINSGQ